MTTELFDFENQVTVLPSGFTAEVGTENVTGNATAVWSTYELDNVVFFSANHSLRISGDNTTNSWYEIIRLISTNVSSIRITYVVSANNVRIEDAQSPNCYIGFRFTDSSGNVSYQLNLFSGTFGWIQRVIVLTSTELESIRNSGTTVEFVIFLSMSGDFWIDDLQFEFTSVT